MRLSARWIQTLCAAAAVTAPTLATAQAPALPWKPEKPITLVVPYAAGGGTDAMARALSKQLGNILAQPVVVENVPGADGLIGARKVMEARPDGYTLLLHVPSIIVTRYLPGTKGVDPLAKLQPITAVAQSPAAIVASGKLPVTSLAGLVDYCRTASRPCSVASGESLARIFAQQIAAEARIPDMVVVNYRGTGPIVTDLIADNVNMAFTGITAALPHHQAGTLKILATMGQTRAPALPNVPTSAEAGFPQFQSVTWYGLFAPKGTPQAVGEALVSAAREAVKSPDVRQALETAGGEPLVNSTAEFAAQVRRDSERLSALVKKYPLQ